MLLIMEKLFSLLSQFNYVESLIRMYETYEVFIWCISFEEIIMMNLYDNERPEIVYSHHYNHLATTSTRWQFILYTTTVFSVCIFMILFGDRLD